MKREKEIGREREWFSLDHCDTWRDEKECTVTAADRMKREWRREIKRARES